MLQCLLHLQEGELAQLTSPFDPRGLPNFVLYCYTRHYMVDKCCLKIEGFAQEAWEGIKGPIVCGNFLA